MRYNPQKCQKKLSSKALKLFKTVDSSTVYSD